MRSSAALWVTSHHPQPSIPNLPSSRSSLPTPPHPTPSSTLEPSQVRQLSSHIKMDVELLKQLNQPPKAYAEGPAIMDSIIKV